MAYVYAIVVDDVIRYIGKGSGTRARQHMRIVRSIARRRAAGETVRASYFYNRLTKAWRAGADIVEIVIADDLTHEQAYAREIAEIAAYPKEQLWNYWGGGEGSSKGYLKPPEQRQKITDSNRKSWTDPSLVAQQSERMKVIWLRPEYREQLIGRKWTPEMRKALSDKRKAQWADPAFRVKMDEANNNPATRQRRSDSTRRGWITRRTVK
jgi:hypothetical protein